MTIELTEDMVFAISVAFDELSNCSDWEDYLEDDQIDTVYEGRDRFTEAIENNKS